eukprot:CAMPEP_0179212656 /NCGR_PEP_ID=MMETSP0797-20121207/1226_1 /TAXON_ID=47934 /ORGANISM="Dinophysis acuminata, Strain DAEP01" /LENGTH=165 /DNA_ID=CAMNT_0020918291 /DNA_START=129 /DNA_END=627 /DNA_ORIENTATION=-
MDTQGRKCAKQGAGLELPSVPQMPAHGSQLSTYCGIQGEQRQEENTEQPINSDGVIAAVAAAKPSDAVIRHCLEVIRGGQLGGLRLSLFVEELPRQWPIRGRKHAHARPAPLGLPLAVFHVLPKEVQVICCCYGTRVVFVELDHLNAIHSLAGPVSVSMALQHLR